MLPRLFLLTSAAVLHCIASDADTRLTLQIDPSCASPSCYSTLHHAVHASRASLAATDALPTAPCIQVVTLELTSTVHALHSTLRMSEMIPPLSRCARPGITLNSPPHSESILSGGVQVTGWVQVAGTSTWTAPLPSLLSSRPTQLFVNDQRRVRCRSPNISPSPFTVNDSNLLPRRNAYSDSNCHHWHAPLAACSAPCWGSCPPVDRLGFVYNATDMPPNASATLTGGEVLVFAAWTAEWATVGSVVAGNSSLLFQDPVPSPVGAFGGVGDVSGARFVLEDVYELLDDPGEWYADDTSVYYVPLAWEDMATVQVIVPNVTTLIDVDGQTGVTLSGIRLEYTLDDGARTSGGEPSVGAIMLSQSSSVSIVNVSIVHTGAHGVFIGSNVSGVTIDGCWIGDTGGDGIGITGSLPEGVSNISITNNVVISTGHIYMNQPTGIRLKGSASIVASHNDVSDTPYSGIAVGWQSGGATAAPLPEGALFNVTYNHVHQYGQGMLNDFGGIYVSAWASDHCWGNPDPVQHGCYIPTYIGNNLIHDGRHFNYGSNNWYLDEAVSGVLFESNIAYDVGNVNMYFHCGLANAAVNNVLAAASAEVGGQGSIGGCNTGGYTPRDNTSSITVLRNIFIVTNGSLTNSNDWYYVADFDNNTYWTPPGSGGALVFPNSTTWAQWQATGQDAHSGVEDPQVADWAAGNFTVLPGSPAWARGWQPIDMSTVGPAAPSPQPGRGAASGVPRR